MELDTGSKLQPIARRERAVASFLSHIKPYKDIARPDHWFKNVFVLPGIILAVFIDPTLLSWNLIPRMLLGAVAVCLLASSNYVLNEIVDAPQDKHHPDKQFRPIPSGKVKTSIAYLEWMLLGMAGLLIASFINTGFFLTSCSLIFMGIMYNVPPIRLKDLPYMDVLSESVNNPIRLLMGWYLTGIDKAIMLSLVMSYWMLGAFLMAVKRYAEYNYIDKKEAAVKYRRSFSYYDKGRLLTNIIYYATAFGLFAGIFLIRYRIELILSIPFIAGFFSFYLHLGFRENSPVQYPEGLYKLRSFMFYTALCFLIIVALLFVNVPFVSDLFRMRERW